MAVRRWVLRMKWKRLESERLEKEAALEAAKIAEAEARAQANAATLVQAHVRGMLARGQYSRDRELVIKLQMAARRWVLRMKWGRLQRARREAEAAAAAAAEASARNRAAVIIQSRLRGGFVRKRRAEYLVALRRLQMAVRRWVLRMKWKRLESERLEKEAALEAAKIAEAEARAQANAATLVQAHVRGMLARGQYSRDRELVIKLQMAARRWVLRMKWGRLQRARREAEAAAAAAEGGFRPESRGGDHPEPTPWRLRAEATCRVSCRASETSDGCAAVGVADEVETPGIGAAGEGGGARGGEVAEAEARAQASTLVQAHVRGMLARGQYSRDRELVIKLQMAARRWVLRKWKRLEKARR